MIRTIEEYIVSFPVEAQMILRKIGSVSPRQAGSVQPDRSDSRIQGN